VRTPGRKLAQDDRPRAEGAGIDHARYVPALLTNLASKLSRSGSALYRRHFGVGTIEWRIMALLAVEPGIPASRICAVIGLDKGPVSRSLAVLETRGLVAVAADAADTRKRLALLTEAGRALHDRILAVAREREHRLLSCLTPAQREALIATLNLLHDNLPAVNAPLDIPAAAAPKPRRAAR
jgi:DNA-binding MarR family transcriptional regulator